MNTVLQTIPRSLPSLTGIRGVAAVWVVLYHIDSLLADYLPSIHQLSFFRSGFRGVDLFFILSGFVLMHANGGEFAILHRNVLARFAVLRFTRVYPLNTVVLGMILLLVVSYPAYYKAYFDRYPVLGFIETLTLSNRWLIQEAGAWNGPTWSLSYEVLAYALFPVMAWWALRQSSAHKCLLICAALLGCVAVFQFATGHSTDNPVFRLAIIRAVLTFASGVILYRLCSLMTIRLPNMMAWTCAAAVVLLTIFPQVGLLMSFAFAGIIIVAPYEGVAVNRFLSCQFCQFLGRISFSLYLIHYTALFFVGWLLETGRVPVRQSWLCAAVAIALSIALSIVLHRYIEVPSQRFGRRWANRITVAKVQNKLKPTSISTVKSPQLDIVQQVSHPLIKNPETVQHFRKSKL